MHTEIAMRHGERLAAELGIDPALVDEFDMDAIKAAMGVSADPRRSPTATCRSAARSSAKRLEEKRRDANDELRS